MIKLQDFARQQGVTDRAIQKHLKKYADELEGLYERKGPNGTWLTEEACEILRGKMKQQPVIVSKHSEELKRLREENTNLLKALNAAKDMIIDLKDKNIALEEANEGYEALKAADELALQELEGTREELAIQKGRNNDLSTDNEELKAKIAASEKNALEAQETAKKLEDDNHLLKQQLENEQKKNQELENRNLWDYLIAPFRNKRKDSSNGENDLH